MSEPVCRWRAEQALEALDRLHNRISYDISLGRWIIPDGRQDDFLTVDAISKAREALTAASRCVFP